MRRALLPPLPDRRRPHPGAGMALAVTLALAGCAPNPLGPAPTGAEAGAAPRLLPLETALATVPPPATGADEAALAARAAALRARGAALRDREI